MADDASTPTTRGVGLCAGCRHSRRVASSRGANFWLCERAAFDARFPRYPTLPVLECAGYEPGTPREVEGRNPERD